MKVALVHDWLIHMRGGEKVLEAIAELFPEATIYTLFCRRERLSASLQRMEIKTSFLQHIPGIIRYYRWLLPILPLAIKTLKIQDEVDLVISSSHCVAKAITIPPRAKHICYCHTPMRYLWGFEDVYFKSYPVMLRSIIHAILTRLRSWDVRSNDTVHEFVSNSENVKERIRKFYGRDAHVIHPPLDEFYRPVDGKKKDYYLVVSAFVPYKRVDLVIKAFNDMDRRLLIVGKGPLEGFYRNLRKSDKISFLGDVPQAELREIYCEAKALIFPTDEDFGIVPLEAQACGTPVLAYRKGGALESVKHGLFFDEQTPAAICRSLDEFEQKDFNPEAIAGSVGAFRKSRFKEKIKNFVDQTMLRRT